MDFLATEHEDWAMAAMAAPQLPSFLDEAVTAAIGSNEDVAGDDEFPELKSKGLEALKTKLRRWTSDASRAQAHMPGEGVVEEAWVRAARVLLSAVAGWAGDVQSLAPKGGLMRNPYPEIKATVEDYMRQLELNGKVHALPSLDPLFHVFSMAARSMSREIGSILAGARDVDHDAGERARLHEAISKYLANTSDGAGEMVLEALEGRSTPDA